MLKRGDFPAGEDGLKAYYRAWHAANPKANRARKWAIDNPERYAENMRRAYLKRTHGITPSEYSEMIKTQNGLCACCGNPDYNKNLAVDHDHVTGKRRKLLCHTCNNHLGIYERKKDMFEAYLRSCET